MCPPMHTHASTTMLLQVTCGPTASDTRVLIHGLKKHTQTQRTPCRAPQSPALTHRYTHKTPEPITLSIPPQSCTHICAHGQCWLVLHSGCAHTPWRGPGKGAPGPRGGRGDGCGPWHSPGFTSEPPFPCLQVLMGMSLTLGSQSGAWALMNEAC